MAKTENILKLDATGIYYRDLNAQIKQAVASGVKKIEIKNINGQRYIGTDIPGEIEFDLTGTPGNDLGAFMNGSRITVHGNAQDGTGNTMNEGQIVIHGHAGDTLGLSARGGRIFVRDGAGYRSGVHMKEYKEKKPVVVIGGTAQDFCGEYMAGGILVLLGLNLENDRHLAKYIGTGIHGGVIYISGTVEEYQLGREVGVKEADEADLKVLNGLIKEYAAFFNQDGEAIAARKFIKLFPRYLRPYGTLYAY
jgi:glutamate synthase domain-containing protein 3